MKTLFLKLINIFPLFICITAAAQDVITLKTGDTIHVKVQKIGTAEIEYKKSDNLEGPSYSIAKDDIHIIQYQNGVTDTLNALLGVTVNKWQSVPPGEHETAQSKHSPQKEYETNIKRSKRAIRTGIICTSIGVPFIAGGSYLLAVGLPLAHKHYDTPVPRSDRQYMGIVVSGWVLLTGGIVSTIIGPVEIGRGVKYKRWANSAKPNLSFVPSVTPANAITGTQTGVAMRITF